MEINMTEGDPKGLILKFFIPMFIGNIFQQFYNVVDSVVIGRFVGSNAFAAVGACFLLMNFVTSIIIGLSMGASLFYSKLYGANDYENMKKAIITGSIFIVGLSIFLSILTLFNMDNLMRVFNMPVETIDYSKEYLNFIFLGLLFTGIYNICAYILRAIGNSRTPLVFLVISCLGNIVLDLLFVLKFDMGVFGVGWATFIAQGVSAVLCLIYTRKHLKFLDIKRKDIKFDRGLFKTILGYSLLTSLQQSISSFGMLLVQGIVNTFGSAVMAAYAACSKIDEFSNRPMQDLSNAFSIYTAQNLGARKMDRIEKGMGVTLKMIFSIGLVISAVVFIFPAELIKIFIKNPSSMILDTGVGYLKTLSIFYTLLGIVVMFYSFFRGLGEMKVSIVLTIFSQGVRVIFSYVLVKTVLGFTGIPVAVVLGWTTSTLLGLYFHKKVMKKYRKEL